VGDNSHILNLSPYIYIYSIVNVKNLKLYESSILDQEEEKHLPSIEYLAPDSHEELEEDTIL
jgi:hypothetical protein